MMLLHPSTNTIVYNKATTSRISVAAKVPRPFATFVHAFSIVYHVSLTAFTVTYS